MRAGVAVPAHRRLIRDAEAPDWARRVGRAASLAASNSLQRGVQAEYAA